MRDLAGLCAAFVDDVLDACAARCHAVEETIAAAVAEVAAVVAKPHRVVAAIRHPQKGTRAEGMRGVIETFRRALKSRTNRGVIRSSRIDDEDVLQEALLKAWRNHPDEAEMRALPGSYAQRIANQKVIDAARAEARRSKRFVSIDDEQHADHAPTAVDRIEERAQADEMKQRARDLQWQLHRGPYQAHPRLREAIGRVAAGEACASVARDFGVATSTITRARDRLAAAIRHEERSPQISLWCA